MPRGKKNPTSAASKTASKIAAEPIKEKAAEPEKKTVTAEKKKATAPKKAAAKSSAKATGKARAAKKTSTSAAVKTENVSVKETETKKAASKTAKKAAAPKRTVRKPAKGKSDEVVFQSGDKNYTQPEITQICKDAYRGGTRKQIKSIKVYVKAEGNQLKAYYVVNDSVSGSLDL